MVTGVWEDDCTSDLCTSDVCEICVASDAGTAPGVLGDDGASDVPVCRETTVQATFVRYCASQIALVDGVVACQPSVQRRAHRKKRKMSSDQVGRLDSRRKL